MKFSFIHLIRLRVVNARVFQRFVCKNPLSPAIAKTLAQVLQRYNAPAD